MNNFTMCSSFIVFAGNNLEFSTNVLFVFAQDNPFKICVDRDNKILEIYKKIACENEIIRTWLKLMSYNKQTYFEKVDVDLEVTIDEKDLFLKVCNACVFDKNLIVINNNDYGSYVDFITTNAINLIDKDMAKKVLSSNITTIINATSSSVAVSGSIITTN